jgi:hypothetical protein
MALLPKDKKAIFLDGRKRGVNSGEQRKSVRPWIVFDRAGNEQVCFSVDRLWKSQQQIQAMCYL